MKILQIISDGYNTGGAEVLVESLKQELCRRGHEVKVLSSDMTGEGMFSDYQFKLIPANSILKAWHHLFYYRSFLALRRVIKEFQPDIIHFHTLQSCSPSVLYATGKVPSLQTIHGPEEFTLKLLPWSLPVSDYKKIPFELDDLTRIGTLRYWYYRFIQRPIYLIGLRRLRAFIVPSKYMAKTIECDVETKKIRQIYNGLSLPRAMPLPNNCRVLFVGRLDKMKGVDYLIRSFSKVVHQVPTAELCIVGDGKERPELEQLTAELKLEKHVVFRGWLDNELVIKEYEKSVVMVIPSVCPENLGTVILEAFAVGRAVIGTRTGGTPELIKDGENGYIIPIKDAPAISKALLKLFNDRKILESMSEAAATRAKDFGIANFVYKIENLYNELLTSVRQNANYNREMKMIKRQKLIIIAVVLVCLISGVYIWELKDISFTLRQGEWSIGIYTGESPFNFVSPENVNNPVLAAKDVTDVPAKFVADPFMVKENSTWYMFFEVMNNQTEQGDIGLAISNDGLKWDYKQIVLDEPFHLSYPYTFKWKGEHYMIPESYQASSVRLYKAVEFPTKWSFVETLIDGSDYVDPSIFYFNEKWWLFVSTTKDNVLRLYYADKLTGHWIEHPESPIIDGDANIARPGGRVLVFDNQIVRYTQDDDPTYGNQVRAFEITELTTASYEEKEVIENPILKGSGAGWNENGMHHIDPHQIDENKWIACVDGYERFWVFKLEY